jgi:hypothetical protein
MSWHSWIPRRLVPDAALQLEAAGRVVASRRARPGMEPFWALRVGLR